MDTKLFRIVSRPFVEMDCAKCAQMTMVVPHLYITNVYTAELGSTQREYGIDCVVSLCGANFPHPIRQMRVKIADRESAPIWRHFAPTFEFIDRERRAGNNVLVHCHSGKSRSSTIILYYLMLSQRQSLRQALKQLYQVRPTMRPNRGFIRQLLQVEEALGLPSSSRQQTTRHGD